MTSIEGITIESCLNSDCWYAGVFRGIETNKGPLELCPLMSSIRDQRKNGGMNELNQQIPLSAEPFTRLKTETIKILQEIDCPNGEPFTEYLSTLNPLTPSNS